MPVSWDSANGVEATNGVASAENAGEVDSGAAITT